MEFFLNDSCSFDHWIYFNWTFVQHWSSLMILIEQEMILPMKKSLWGNVFLCYSWSDFDSERDFFSRYWKKPFCCIVEFHRINSLKMSLHRVRLWSNVNRSTNKSFLFIELNRQFDLINLTVCLFVSRCSSRMFPRHIHSLNATLFKSDNHYSGSISVWEIFFQEQMKPFEQNQFERTFQLNWRCPAVTQQHQTRNFRTMKWLVNWLEFQLICSLETINER
jgi:hypothetical protein